MTEVAYLLEKVPQRLLNFFVPQVRRLIKGGAYSRAALV